MRRVLGRYTVEIFIGFLGVAAAAVEAIVTDRADIAVLVAFTALLLALSVAAIRQEIERQIDSTRSERQIIDAISNAEWRAEARAELERTRSELISWASGIRRVPVRASLGTQVSALDQARQSVRAVHVALQRDSLEMMGDPQRGFHSLIKAYQRLPDAIDKQRILVLDADDRGLSTVDAGHRRIVNELVERVVRLNLSGRDAGGLGFVLRILWLPAKSRKLSDQLIVDNACVYSIDAYGNGQFGDLEVCINPPTVAARLRAFADLWVQAVPAEQFLRL